MKIRLKNVASRVLTSKLYGMSDDGQMSITITHNGELKEYLEMTKYYFFSSFNSFGIHV